MATFKMTRTSRCRSQFCEFKKQRLVKVQAQAVREGLQSDIPAGLQVQVLFPPFHKGWDELGVKIHLFGDRDVPMFDSHCGGRFVASRKLEDLGSRQRRNEHREGDKPVKCIRFES